MSGRVSRSLASRVVGRVSNWIFQFYLWAFRPSAVVVHFNKSQILGYVKGVGNKQEDRVLLKLNGVTIADAGVVPALENFGRYRHEFFFSLSELLDYCGKFDKLSVHYEGRQLLIRRVGRWKRFSKKTESKSHLLLEKISTGHVFNQFGHLQLSKDLDDVWKAEVVALYRIVNAAMLSLGYSIFPFYGTLLGAVREQDFISNDHDMDAAFLANGRSPSDVKLEVLKVCASLRSLGLVVELSKTNFYVSQPGHSGTSLDVFYLYFDSSEMLKVPFGVASVTPINKNEILGVEEVFLGQEAFEALAPAKLIVEFIYGRSWQTPTPGFSWRRNRRQEDQDSMFLESEIIEANRV